jgi:hypothetical protein
MPIEAPAAPRRSWPRALAALALVAASAVAGSGLARLLRQPAKGQAPTGQAAPQERLFAGWPKPDVAVLLSAQQHGYLLPCGCSRPQVGGLERRWNFLSGLRKRGWPVLALDLGDVPQKQGIADLPNLQGLIKYRYSMSALKAMGYAAVGMGEHEALPTFDETIGAFALNHKGPPYVLAANYPDRAAFADAVHAWRHFSVPGGDLTVGVTALVGPSAAERINLGHKDNPIAFADSAPTLKAVLAEMDAAKVGLRVLLYHGSLTLGLEGHPPEAVALAKMFPQFHVVLCLTEEDTPPAEPTWVEHGPGKGRTLVAGVGHKGKHVGVAGVWKTGRAEGPFELRYQMVELTEDYLTPPEKRDDHPVNALMERYTQEVKRHDFLGLYAKQAAKHPLQVAVEGKSPKYVGSERCGDCHPSAYRVWKDKTPHSHAYQTLVDARRPSLRQYDPECLVCHTVGLGYQSGFAGADKTPKLLNVGCESCHGPGGMHVADVKDPTWHKLMNPWKTPEKETPEEREKRRLLIDLACQKCHDHDNDVTWVNRGFDRKWPLIAHPTPPEER